MDPALFIKIVPHAVPVIGSAVGAWLASCNGRKGATETSQWHRGRGTNAGGTEKPSRPGIRNSGAQSSPEDSPTVSLLERLCVRGWMTSEMATTFASSVRGMFKNHIHDLVDYGV